MKTNKTGYVKRILLALLSRLKLKERNYQKNIYNYIKFDKLVNMTISDTKYESMFKYGLHKVSNIVKNK